MSRICSSLDESVADLQKCDLSDVTYPYIWFDATYIRCRDAGRVQSIALVTAIGVGSGGCRRLLGLDAIDTESYDGWKSFLLSLRARGVDGVTCVTSDAHEGLKRAIQGGLPGRRVAALHRASDAQRRRQRADQAEKVRCAGHPEGRVRRSRPRAREGALPTRHAQIGGFCPKAAEVLEEGEADALAYLDFSYEHHVRLRTNNV